MAEGEGFVIAGGALAQRGLLDVWAVGLAAFGGSVAMDQICFLLGRHFREHRWVKRQRTKPTFARAIRFVERHPNGYILAFRYLYGLRIVSPVAIGLTKVSSMRFLLLNMASAAVWAAAFTGIGYWAGSAYRRLFGEAESLLLLPVAVIILTGIGGAIAHRWFSRPDPQARSAPEQVVDQSA